MKRRYYNVDFLRVVFAVIIVYFHILHSNIMGFTGDNAIYADLQKRSDNAMFIVEMFFIMAGFFFYYSYHGGNKKWGEFVLGKVFRLWPVLACAVIVGGLLGSFTQNDILNLFFLQCMGISLEYKGINWYISSYFWAGIFLFGVLKNVKQKHADFVIGILVYISYVINLNYCHGGFGRETVYGIFSLGLLRGIAGMGLGYLMASGYEYIKQSDIRSFFQFKSKLVEVVLFTILETFSFGYILYFTVVHNLEYVNKFIFVVIFVVLFSCFVLNRGLVSKACNQKIFGILGRYTFSIYAMQQFCFTVMQKTIWKQQKFVKHVWLCLAVSILLAVVVGSITYYCVEKPCAVFYRKRRAGSGKSI